MVAPGRRGTTRSLAVVVSHPIQHFAAWFRELNRLEELEVKVLYCCDWGVHDYYDPEFGSSFRWDVPLLEGYPHEFLPIRRRPRRLTFRQVDNPNVGKSLDGFRPDVVMAFGYRYRTIWRAWAWARRRGRPFLLYSDSAITSRTPPWKRIVKDPIVRSFYRHVDGAFAVGDNNRAYHLRYGLPADRIFEGVYPVDRERLLAATPNREEVRRSVRERLGIPKEAFVVLFCGKLVDRKRPLDVVRAVGLNAKRAVSPWAVLVGDGPQRRQLERFARTRGMLNVALIGFANQSQIATYYAASDVLVVASAQDPHPLVVTEAACFGLPVLVSDAIGCIGPNDTARPGVNTLVYPCGNVAALARLIRVLGSSPELRSHLGKGSWEIAARQDAGRAASLLAGAVAELVAMGRR
jgi:glycosyltransferase involved in cell wall biosynthesis